MPQGSSCIKSSSKSNIILRMSSSTVSTVAIAGITGKLGQLIAKAVLGYPQANIRGFCRDQSKLSPDLSSDPRVTILQGPSDDPAAARKAVQGSDVVICAYLGPNGFMVQSQKILIDAAEAEKVPRYIASDWALDYTKLKLGDLPPKDPMIEIKAYLETKKDIKGVHILNGAFMQLVQMAFQQDPVGYWGSGDEKWDFTSHETCAEYTAAIAMDPSAVGVIKGPFPNPPPQSLPPLSPESTNNPHSARRPRQLQRIRRHLYEANWQKAQHEAIRNPGGAAREDG